MTRFEIVDGDCRRVLRSVAPRSVRCCVTSPPYWNLRDYGDDGQLGHETTLSAYVEALVDVLASVYDALADDGTLWLNLGDCYSTQPPGSRERSGSRLITRQNRVSAVRRGKFEGLERRQLCGVPWRVAFALQEFGWILRSDIIWAKRNPMPESVRNRPTRAHEFLFLFAKSPTYLYNFDAIAEPATGRAPGNVAPHKYTAETEADPVRLRRAAGLERIREGYETRNRRSVWSIASEPYAGAHFATCPTALVEPCILAGSNPGDLVLDPFAGAGTIGLVARRLGRSFLGIELNPKFATLARRRCDRLQLELVAQPGGLEP